MNVLITGGAGFIGSHLSENLKNDKRIKKIYIIDNLTSGSKKNISGILKDKKIKFIKQDIKNINKIKNYFKNVSVVFHLAGLVDVANSINNPLKYLKNNLLGTLNILECMKLYNVKKIIFAASSSCYGNAGKNSISESQKVETESPYAYTKNSAEELIKLFSKINKINFVSLRLFNVYGPRAKMTGNYASVVSIFLRQKKNNKPLTIVGDGNQSRDFVHVADVVEAFKKASFSKNKNKVYNIGTGKSVTINKITKIFGGRKRFIPKRVGDLKFSRAKISKVKKDLKWIPKKKLNKSIQKLIENLC